MGTDRTDGGATRPDWTDLPATVRAAIVTVAARMLTAVPAETLPAALRPIARFTPAKRARHGAVALGRALGSDDGFRALVAQYLPRDFGTGGDAVAAAARAYLLGLPDLATHLTEIDRADENARLHAEVARLTAAVEELAASLTRRVAAAPPPASLAEDGGTKTPAADATADRLRSRLRAQGTKHRAELDAADRARAVAVDRLAAAEERAAATERELDQWRMRARRDARRADEAEAKAGRAAADAGQRRADDDRRIMILLDTIEGAVAGLRGEWRPAGGGESPAETVLRGLGAPARVLPVAHSADPQLIGTWLRMPHAHVIVDGYNVTKEGYGHLSLAQQRERLVRAMATLVARTGAEATVVFDGADVVAPTSSTAGVRVLFSPAGVIADDVIRRLVAGEPAGRIVIVVTSDSEIVADVRRAGARTVPSSSFLEIL